ncbi:hypothetical protein ColKHC_10189 [Colletotrichum higginsianum]|nr:hypothetical protein ColKHC_10189 [Colletotrichum higginsianum]
MRCFGTRRQPLLAVGNISNIKPGQFRNRIIPVRSKLMQISFDPRGRKWRAALPFCSVTSCRVRGDDDSDTADGWTMAGNGGFS